MVKVIVTDTHGTIKEVDASVGEPLMYSLRDNDVGLEAICGGSCACATCHVYISDPWFGGLPAPSEDEIALLEMLNSRKANSRLCCQVEVTDDLDGVAVTVGGFE